MFFLRILLISKPFLILTIRCDRSTTARDWIQQYFAINTYIFSLFYSNLEITKHSSTINAPGLKLIQDPIQFSETPKRKLPTDEHCLTSLAVAHMSRLKAEDPLHKSTIAHDGWHQPTCQLITTAPPAKCQHRSLCYFSSYWVNLWKFLQLILVRELFIHILLIWVAN